jgi:peptidoglycan-associated lipoprotein
LRSRARLLLLLAAAAASAACPKPKPPPQEVPDEGPPKPPAVEIFGVEPASSTEGRAVTVTATGRGFLAESEVFLNSRRAAGVDVIGDGELTFRATEDLPAGTYDLRVVTPQGDQASLARAFTVKPKPSAGACNLQIVYFAYDEAALSASAQQALTANVKCMEQNGWKKVTLEGHADERGSTEYNLSLGERRAESAKDYVVSLGLDAGAVRLLSYGEERPADAGHDEAAWVKNRRVEFVIP